MTPQVEVRLGTFDPRAHAALLRGWLQRPHVAQWWGDAQSILEGALVWPIEECALIEADGRPVGYMCWQTPSEDERSAAGLEDQPQGLVDIDILVGEPEFLGRGIGPQSLSLLLARLRENPQVLVAGVGTAASNDRAVKAFERAGFRTLREFQDPVFGPCLYMVVDVSGDAA